MLKTTTTIYLLIILQFGRACLCLSSKLFMSAQLGIEDLHVFIQISGVLEKITIMAEDWLNFFSLPWQTLILQSIFLSTPLTNKVVGLIYMTAVVQDGNGKSWQGLSSLSQELAKHYFQYILLIKSNHKGQQEPSEGEIEFTFLGEEQHMYARMGDIFGHHLCTRSFRICQEIASYSSVICQLSSLG